MTSRSRVSTKVGGRGTGGEGFLYTCGWVRSCVRTENDIEAHVDFKEILVVKANIHEAFEVLNDTRMCVCIISLR